MPVALQSLTNRPPVAGTSASRHRSRLPTVAHSEIPCRKLSTTPLTWKRRSFTGTPSIGAAVKCRQGDGDGEYRLPQVSSSHRSKPLAKFVTDNFLPLALVSGVVLGFVNPSLGCLADRYYLSKVSTFGIFLISGLTLQDVEIRDAVKAWQVGLFGLVSILFLSPLFSKIILQLKLQPQEFVTGIAMFTCMPTTLSSGVALTRLAGGNSALALAMTLISNLLGIFIIPFSISKFIASGIGVSVPSGRLLRSLVLTLFLPLVLGKIARDLSKAPPFPSDPTVRKVADKLASFVAKNGRQFEHVTRQKNPGDTPFKSAQILQFYINVRDHFGTHQNKYIQASRQWKTSCGICRQVDRIYLFLILVSSVFVMMKKSASWV